MSAAAESPSQGQQVSGSGKTTPDAQGNPLSTAGTTPKTPTPAPPPDNATVTSGAPGSNVTATGNAVTTASIATRHGYKVNSDGTFTGPDKGSLTHVGTAADGVTPVFQRPTGEYFTLNSAGKQETVSRGDTGNGIQWKNPIGGGSQAGQNWIKGREFQDTFHKAQNIPENLKPVTVTLPDGTRVTTIPDSMGTKFGIVEVKDVVSLSMNNQFRAQMEHATKEKVPYTLVVSPSNKVISKDLWDGIIDVKGAVYQFNPKTGAMTRISKRPK
ncbi:hypothetical protein D5038_20845 [Verminephrobacter aporrectodeae subsp. tuberculatae]|uniref:putative toxin n=1 Tax=Verminephrobacter aporrectodeae TaxID=1110389 RepID=UPI0022380E08|nr:putative toxin [Verminephrobacter aporrectodeae]MCW5258705.1 hypothetical protein [Verminephrobacter aporrectodeae subsp. tuberculatae]